MKPTLRSFLALGLFVSLGTTTHAQTLEVTLTASAYGDYNISCFGMKDGSIDATISGGTSPYTYLWSNKLTTEDLSGLSSGYYKLVVTDSNFETATAEITLTEPIQMRLRIYPFTYPNGMNISCHQCYNGSIDLVVQHGVTPYTYNWNDGVHTEDRSGLGAAMKYAVEVIDANGCQVVSEKVALSEPERNDWTMEGNEDTDPAIHYFGTTDEQDVVFKSDGTERLRLLGTGDIKLTAVPTEGNYGLLVTDPDGIVKRLGDVPEHLDPCPPHAQLPWTLCGNTISFGEYIGTNNAKPFWIKTNALLRMVVANDGRVGIGVQNPADQLEVHTTLVQSGLTLVNDRTDDNAQTVVRFKKGNVNRWTLGCDKDQNGGQDFFLFDATGIGHNRLRVDLDGQVAIGEQAPTDQLDVQTPLVSGGITISNVGTDPSASATIRFNKEAQVRYVMGTDLAMNGGQDFFLRDELGTATYRLRVDDAGKVAIGDDAPKNQLDVQTNLSNGGITLRNMRGSADPNAHTSIRFSKGPDNGSNNDGRWTMGCDWAMNGGQDFFLYDHLSATMPLVVNGDGKVGIGAWPTPGPINGYRLYVEDGIATRDVLVTIDTWPDYVFDHNYHLMSLVELRTFLNTNHHLPGVPSASELEAKGGVAVGEMQRDLLRTVEEQALYILQLEERLGAVERVLETLDDLKR